VSGGTGGYSPEEPTAIEKTRNPGLNALEDKIAGH
jgi:hypothetical protein